MNANRTPFSALATAAVLFACGSSSETVPLGTLRSGADFNADDSGASFNAGADGSIDSGPTQTLQQFCSSASGSGVPIPGTADCSGGLASRTFLFGLCSCQDLVLSGSLTTDSFNSSTGQSGKIGSVGVRSRMTASTIANIYGSLWVAGLGGMAQPVVRLSGTDTIAGELHSGGDVGGASVVSIGADAYVNGSVGGGAFATIAGVLHVPPGVSPGSATSTGGVQRQSVSVADPCRCGTPLDIASIVATFEKANDDAAGSASRDALIAPTGTNLTLSCGRYYFEGASFGGPTTIRLKGRTAIFIHGDLDVVAIFDLVLDPGADLDLFITGNVSLGGAQAFGLPNKPAKIRMYVGGTRVDLMSVASLGANLYAPNAVVRASGSLSVWGSIYANQIALTTVADFHYDSAILQLQGCAPPAKTCKDCHDCGGSAPACVGGSHCGACQTDADCCAPLACRAGACTPLTPK